MKSSARTRRRPTGVPPALPDPLASPEMATLLLVFLPSAPQHRASVTGHSSGFAGLFVLFFWPVPEEEWYFHQWAFLNAGR